MPALRPTILKLEIPLKGGYFQPMLNKAIALAREHEGSTVTLDTGAQVFTPAELQNDPVREKCPLIYIAGPFRAETPWEIEQNIRRAEEHGLRVAKLGGIPVIPHSMYRFFQNSLPDTFWLEAGLTMLRTCDAVAVCVDELRAPMSAGTMNEVCEAEACGLPRFFNGANHIGALKLWIETWIKEHT